MHTRQILALCGAILALVLVPSSAALAAGGTRVTVRVEGKTQTLLAPTIVTTHSGSITKAGAPKGACSATSGMGALDVATHHNWSGKWYTSLKDYLINKILGDTESGKSSFWELFVNNVASQTGACGTKLHPSDKLLFAAVPSNGIAYPLGLTAPSSAKVGQSFPVKVVWFNGKGNPKPLAGATVSVNGHSGKTNNQGMIPGGLKPSHSGTYTITASKTGYIRPAPVSLHVTA